MHQVLLFVLILAVDSVCGSGSVTETNEGFVIPPARVQVSFLTVPYIVHSSGRRLLTQQNGGGNTIYFRCQRQTSPQGQQAGPCVLTYSSVTLRCMAEGNPRPQVSWTSAGGARIGTGNALTIQATNALSIGSVQCISQSYNQQQNSTSVRLMIYERPTLYQNNFKQISESSDFVGQRMRLNSQFTLECKVYGSPKPIVFWRQTRQGSMNQQKIYNISCAQGAESATSQDTATPAGRNTPVAIVTSQCQVLISDYSMQGDFWCEPCVEIAQGAYDCSNPNRNDTVPSPNAPAVIKINVVGKPQKLRHLIVPGCLDQLLQIDYCADPKPNDDGVTWIIDGEQLRPGSSHENLEAANIEPVGFPLMIKDGHKKEIVTQLYFGCDVPPMKTKTKATSYE